MKILTLGFIGFILFIFGYNNDLENNFNRELSLNEALTKLGDAPSPNAVKSVRGASVENGKSIFHDGFSKKRNGSKTRKQSKHFVCTSCHNTVQERPNFTSNNPQERLDYSVKNNIPFLQGTSMYGAVNRTSFYNDDYFKKYGELTTEARNDIRKSIQLCAVECAQGRKLADWEIESVLAYLWTLEIKLEDLELSEEDNIQLQKAYSNEKLKDEALAKLKSKYQTAAPATMLYPPENRNQGFELEGDKENGEKLYKASCLHCHQDAKYSFFSLDESKQSLKYLSKHISKYSPYSLYQVTRYGTSPMNGKKAYMPFYTEEKMSNQMLEDLRAYIEQ